MMPDAPAFPDTTSFASALAASPTFLPSVLSIFLAGLAMAALAAAPLAFRLRHRPRRPLASLHQSAMGAVLAADLVMVIIPLTILMLVMTQTLWMMRENVIVHYAAFNAARSARAHLCPLIPESLPTAILQATGKAGCTNRRQPAEFAARMSLISASPPWGIPCQGACDIPDRALRAIGRQTGVDPQSNAIRDQARYAFDTDNVQLEVGFDQFYIPLMVKPGAVPPVRAQLTFRNYVIFGLGPFIGTRRSDGYYYVETRAEVTVL